MKGRENKEEKTVSSKGEMKTTKRGIAEKK